MKRPHRESPLRRHFVGYSQLSYYWEKAKWRHRFNKEKRQHAVDQMVYGLPLLRPPENETELQLYKSYNVLCTSAGEYFLAFKPLPPALASRVIGIKPTQHERGARAMSADSKPTQLD